MESRNTTARHCIHQIAHDVGTKQRRWLSWHPKVVFLVLRRMIGPEIFSSNDASAAFAGVGVASSGGAKTTLSRRNARPKARVNMDYVQGLIDQTNGELMIA
jgi:hypothetical protein